MKTVSPVSVGLSPERLKRLDQTMQQYVDRQVFAGAVTLVARHGQVAHFSAFGWQEIETHRPMALDTIFRLYSMTKPVTSVAVMMLYEEGRLRLFDPLSRYLPEFKDMKVMMANGSEYRLVPANREVTLHDLLTHTSGLSYGMKANSPLDTLYQKLFERIEQEVEPVLETRMHVIAQAKLPLAFQPGTAFRYSIATDILAYIVQLVSGQPFTDFLQQRIFAPLGMVDSAFWVPPEKVDRLAAVYGPAEGGGLQVVEAAASSRYTQPTQNPSGGSGLLSTASDYYRFGQMLLNGGQLDGARLLGRKTVEWMLQNHLPEGVYPTSERAHPLLERSNGFGLGGAVLINPGLSSRIGSLGRFGWGGGANTEWTIDPIEGLNMIFMGQYMPSWTIPIVDDFAQIVYQALE